MTYLERYLKENPNYTGPIDDIAISYCPREFIGKCSHAHVDNFTCKMCWNLEIPEEKVEGISHDDLKPIADAVVKGLADGLEDGAKHPIILDSGTRREFESGAVRDIQEGKGRCDLLPLNVIGAMLDDPIFALIEQFQETANCDYLFAIFSYTKRLFPDQYTMILEISKHFEEGCKKYGENNWRKGIPAKCYVDSAVRHYLKWLRGDKDEPHDRAFVWNILCCIWTCQNKPELNTYHRNTAEEK